MGADQMNSSDVIRLVVLTPQATLFEGFVEKVELPGSKGRFMVLKNHAPIISSLSEGWVAYTSEGRQERIGIQKGFVRTGDNEIVVCAEV